MKVVKVFERKREAVSLKKEGKELDASSEKRLTTKYVGLRRKSRRGQLGGLKPRGNENCSRNHSSVEQLESLQDATSESAHERVETKLPIFPKDLTAFEMLTLFK